METNEGLRELIDAFRAPLVGLVASWGASWADATEVAIDSLSEAYLKRHRCRGDWRDPDVFGPWVRGIARNMLRNRLRAHRRRRQRELLSEEALEQVGHAAPEEPSERVLALRKAIDQLPKPQRQVVLMHYLDETRIADVAALLGITPKAVEGRLYQARRRLKQRLGAPPARREISRMLLCL